MTSQKILTLHPRGKTGRNIDKSYYNMIKIAILEILKSKALTHDQLFAELNKRLRGKLPGSVNWYGETVKLDLEARRLIIRTKDKPQEYKLI